MRLVGREAWQHDQLNAYIDLQRQKRTLELCPGSKEQRPPCPTVREEQKRGEADGHGQAIPSEYV